MLLLAYRRGLLREGYPQGLASRARELVLTDMLEMEEHAETIYRILNIRATMLGPNVDLKQYGNIIKEMLSDVRTSQKYHEYALYHAKEQELIRMRQAEMLLENLNKLEEVGIIDQFKKEAEEWRKEVEERQKNM